VEVDVNYFDFVSDAMYTLLNSKGAFFESTGLSLFRSFMLIQLVWIGIQGALSSAQGGPGFSFARFFAFLQESLIVYTMLAFYSTPIPGLGISFTRLILDQATALVQQLDQSTIQNVLHDLDRVETALPAAAAYEVITGLRFLTIALCIVIAEAATLFVVMFGYVATAVLVLLGPIMIPFKIFPQMDWMFWGWLRSFIQYAFYQVVAAAYIYIFGNFLTQVVAPRTNPFSTEELAYLFVPILMALVTFILGIFKIPSLVFSLFSGRSGDYILPWWK